APADVVPPAAPVKRRGLVWVIGLVLVVGAGLAGYQLMGSSKPTDFTDPDGVFSARFPNSPEGKVVSEAQPLMLRWGERLYQAKVWGTEYSVAVLDGLNAGDQPYGPTSRDTHTNEAAVMVMVNANGRHLTERTADHEGHVAREVVFVNRDD